MSDEILKVLPEWFRAESDEAYERAKLVLGVNAAERVAVSSFLSLVDRLGLRIPGGKVPKWGNPFTLIDEEENRIGPHLGYALAQHHGCPTRLLDWTTNSLYAAYFAVQDVDPNESGRLVVWAIHTLALQQDWRIFQVPHSEIGYLHAQQSVFTYFRAADTFYLLNGRWPQIDDGALGPTVLRRLTLPNSEARELLRILWLEGVSLADLMPTHDNISRTLEIFFTRIT